MSEKQPGAPRSPSGVSALGRWARQAAELLKTQFDATHVVVFGSLNRPKIFNEYSDMDIAAWGLFSKDWFLGNSNCADVSESGSVLQAAVSPGQMMAAPS